MSRNNFTLYNLYQRLCQEAVNIHIMDSVGKGHSSNKKTEQPGTYATLSYFYLQEQLLRMKLTGEEGPHTH